MASIFSCDSITTCIALAICMKKSTLLSKARQYFNVLHTFRLFETYLSVWTQSNE